jgi:hypothetical protein
MKRTSAEMRHHSRLRYRLLVVHDIRRDRLVPQPLLQLGLQCGTIAHEHSELRRSGPGKTSGYPYSIRTLLRKGYRTGRWEDRQERLGSLSEHSAPLAPRSMKRECRAGTCSNCRIPSPLASPFPPLFIEFPWFLRYAKASISRLSKTSTPAGEASPQLQQRLAEDDSRDGVLRFP